MTLCRSQSRSTSDALGGNARCGPDTGLNRVGGGLGLTLRLGFRCRPREVGGCQDWGAAMTVRTARCACQACEVEVDGEPVSSGLCSCDNCKRRTGAPFGWSVYFHDEQVSRVEGPLAVLEGFGKRWFCSRCGSTIYWRSFGAWRPGQTGFAGGCFADPTLPVPTIAVRCAQGMPWIAYPESCAVFDDMPPVPPSSA